MLSYQLNSLSHNFYFIGFISKSKSFKDKIKEIKRWDVLAVAAPKMVKTRSQAYRNLKTKIAVKKATQKATKKTIKKTSCTSKPCGTTKSL